MAQFNVGEITPFIRQYRTMRGRLTYAYRDMRDRVNGKPLRTGMAKTPENCPWKGMELMDRDEFIQWALNDPGFKERFKEWEEDGFLRRSAPTIHRIDRARGYTLDNVMWVKHAEKSRQHIKRKK